MCSSSGLVGLRTEICFFRIVADICSRLGGPRSLQSIRIHAALKRRIDPVFSSCTFRHRRLSALSPFDLADAILRRSSSPGARWIAGQIDIDSIPRQFIFFLFSVRSSLGLAVPSVVDVAPSSSDPAITYVGSIDSVSTPVWARHAPGGGRRVVSWWRSRRWQWLGR